MIKKMLLSTVVMTALTGLAYAQEKETEIVFYKTQTEHCTIKATAMPKWSVLDVRMSRKETGQNCALTTEETVRVFSMILRVHKETDDQKTYTSMMIGHLEDYAWIQNFLLETARGDATWSQTTGRPVTGNENVYVNGVLSDPAVIDVFNEAGEKFGYSFRTVDCEKVFISGSGLPLDAFCGIEIIHE